MSNKGRYGLKLTVSLLPLSDFAKFSGEWDGLLAKSNADPLFSSWQWMFNWWQQWGGSKARLIITLVRDHDGVLVGIAPFYIEKAPFPHLFFPINRMQMLGACSGRPGGRTEHQQFIALKEYESVIVDELWKSIFLYREWSELIVGDLDRDSETYHSLMRCLPSGIYCRDEGQEYSYQIDVSSTFEEYLALLGKNTRLKVFNRRKTLARHGEPVLEIWPVSKFSSFIHLLNECHVTRWGKPCFAGEGLDFHQQLANWLESNNGLVCHVLSINGAPIAVSMDYRVGEKLYNIQHGYKPDFDKKIALGSLMLGYVTEWACKKPEIKSFDLLAGAGKHTNYKARIASEGSNFTSWRLCRGWRGHIYKLYDAVRLN